MEEIKVKAVEAVEEKGVQQVEQELLDKYNESQSEKTEQTENNTEEVSSEPQEEGVNDTNVLSYIKNKYDKDISSIDELFAQKEVSGDLPEDVAAFYEYKKETGRGINDFVKLNTNYDDADPDTLLAEYYLATKPHLDNEDVQFEIEHKFSYDEDGDEDWEKKEKKIAKKEELAKAREYFEDQKSKYKAPVESTGPWSSDEDKKNYESYKKYNQDQESMKQESQKRSEFFTQKTDELFNEKFEGFKFNVNDNEYVYKPTDAEKLKETQSDINNFIGMHLNEDGYVKDVNEYHKSLAVAMNPQAFAKYFYEQGKSDAVTDSAKKAKNIDMGIRTAPESRTTGGMKIQAVPTTHGNGLKIRSKKNN